MTKQQHLQKERERAKLRYYKDPQGWYLKRRYSNWRWLLNKKFGITVEQYYKMWKAQKKVCAICGENEKSKYKGKKKRLAVDHCHNTGKIRGLLCTKCNTGIAQFNDDKKLILKAINYIERYK